MLKEEPLREENLIFLKKHKKRERLTADVYREPITVRWMEALLPSGSAEEVPALACLVWPRCRFSRDQMSTLLKGNQTESRDDPTRGSGLWEVEVPYFTLKNGME